MSLIQANTISYRNEYSIKKEKSSTRREARGQPMQDKRVALWPLAMAAVMVVLPRFRVSSSVLIRLSNLSSSRHPLNYRSVPFGPTTTTRAAFRNVFVRCQSTGSKKKKRRPSSTRWLQRHVQDEYVQRANQEGLVSRSSYKLEQIDQSVRFLFSKGASVLDLGAAPGGWSVYASRQIGPSGKIVSVDLLDLDTTAWGELDRAFAKGRFQFLRRDVRTLQGSALGEKFHVVLSDMAANTTGDSRTDAIQTMNLCEQALRLATRVLHAPGKDIRSGGSFVGKLFDGGNQNDQKELKEFALEYFSSVKFMKPKASRKTSPERYLVATGFHGAESQ